MSTRTRKPLKALAVFLVFAIAQVYVQISFAEPSANNAATALPQNIIVARLVTTNNQPISVNGASAVTGATILTGASIQTPADVGATINLGALGTVDLAPNTIVRLEFDENGNIKVTLVQGCVIVNAKKKTQGEILTDQGSAAKTDRAAGGVLDACFPPGASGPTVGQGAAANAGAGAGGALGGGGGAAAGGGGIGTAAIIAIAGGIAGAAIGVPLAFRGGESSPSSPSN